MSISTEIVSTNQNIDTETKQHNDKTELISDIIKFMRKNGYFVGKLGSHKEMKEFLISIL